MARKTVLVARTVVKEVEEVKAIVRANFNDARRGSKQADLCDDWRWQVAGKQSRAGAGGQGAAAA